MAPDIILEIDHIKPVSSGGTNDILNLVTSCRDCNRGKGKREISDDSAIKKQQAALKDLADKNEQLEMMVRWKDELLELDQKSIDALCDYLNNTFGITVNESGKQKMRTWVKQYTVKELISAIDEAFSNTFHKSINTAFSEVPKYAFYNKNPTSPDKKQVMYLRKILVNRFGCSDNQKRILYGAIEGLLFDYLIPFETLRNAFCSCEDWSDLARTVREWTNP